MKQHGYTIMDFSGLSECHSNVRSGLQLFEYCLRLRISALELDRRNVNPPAIVEHYVVTAPPFRDGCVLVAVHDNSTVSMKIVEQQATLILAATLNGGAPNRHTHPAKN